MSLNMSVEFRLLDQVKYKFIILLISRYQNIVANTEKKKYDVLDHRKADFEADYEEFIIQVDNLQLALQNFMDSWFERSLNTEYLLELMKKFNNIAGAK